MVPAAQRRVDLAAHRRDVDDPASLLRAHRRQQQLRQPTGAEDVHLELVSRLIQTDLLHRPIEAEAGIVDQHVHAARLRRDALDRGHDLRLAGEVHAKRLRAEPTEVFHFGDAAGGDIDLVAVGHQPFRDFLAHAG